ncbi:MAG: DUF362 domain-containing protein [Prolixibacteraceae bacterium]
MKQIKQKFASSKFSTTAVFLFMGIGSTIWFLIRVIPKPQRAGYPCMKAAAPIMSGFVVYILTLAGSVLFFKNAYSKLKQSRFLGASLSITIALVLVVVFNFKDAQKVFSNPATVNWTRGELPDGANNPMGTGFGVFPGRVAWVRNVNATNENCPNTITNSFVMEKNNDQIAINDLANKSILTIGGQSTVKDSWDAIFKSFNKKKSGSETSYTAGQTIFIKVNNGQAGWAINNDMTERGNNSATGVKNAAMSNTTPATVLAFVRQLVDECGIPQNKIYVAEPMTHVYQSLYNYIHDSYPDVIILDKENKTKYGRTTSSGWTKDVIKYSDQGTEMQDAVSDALMNEMVNADYLINLAALKAHARGGVTLTAKQHFGSHGDHPGYGFGSFHLHDGLISTVDNDRLDKGVRGEYGMYRVLTDFMGHEKLGGNTVLFVVDGLWGGIEATDMPVKWKSAPFNNDFPNSLFVSQDAVALESVCLDFLRAEADVNDAFNDRPFFPAVDDHLHQAADKANWAAGITYDPEGDGTEMPASLGVHEHWNNATDKEYTKNLDATNGKGIELVSVMSETGTGVNNLSNLSAQVTVYPNPCTTNANVAFTMKQDAVVEFSVVNMNGQIIQKYQPSEIGPGSQIQTINTSNWSKGNYVVVMKATSSYGIETSTTRLMVK